ncbi:MAG: hypothetical protein WA628_01785 [Terriglobales bacterium]
MEVAVGFEAGEVVMVAGVVPSGFATWATCVVLVGGMALGAVAGAGGNPNGFATVATGGTD